jgi:hypothetical protein
LRLCDGLDLRLRLRDGLRLDLRLRLRLRDGLDLRLRLELRLCDGLDLRLSLRLRGSLLGSSRRACWGCGGRHRFDGSRLSLLTRRRLGWAASFRGLSLGSLDR